MVEDLVLSVQLEVSPGVFLELENEAGGYEVSANSFTARSVSHRQQTVETQWVEGTTVLASVRENIVETLEIWIDGGGSHFTFDSRVQAVMDALEQLVYRLKVKIGDSLQTWTCQPAQSTITTSQPYLVATTGLINAQIPRLPTMTVEVAL